MASTIASRSSARSSGAHERGASTSTTGQGVAANFLNLVSSIPVGAYAEPGDEANDDLTAAGVSKTCLASLAQMAGPALTPEMRERLVAQGVRGPERAGEESARTQDAAPSASQKKRERKKNAAARKKNEPEGEAAIEAAYAYEAPAEPVAPTAVRMAAVAVAAAPVAAAAAVTQPSVDALQAGARVVIGGLQGRPELNGKHGVVLSFDDVRTRYAVRVDGGSESVLLRGANLTAATASVGDEVASRNHGLDSLAWALRVDYLSVASLIVLVVGRRIGAPLEASCRERGMLWCDDTRRLEWQKDTAAQAVPCLSGTPRGATGQQRTGEAVQLAQPSVILSTILAVWGGGRLLPQAGSLALLRHDELVARAFEAVVRPVALHLFHACWDGTLAFEAIEETCAALRWVDAHVASAGGFPSQGDAAKLTLLHVVAAVPCLLLRALGTGAQSRDGGVQHTSFVADAMRAMPRFQAWLLAAHAMLGADVEALARRSPQFAHYRSELASTELQTLLVAGSGSGTMSRDNGPQKKPSWPYENLMSAHDRRRGDDVYAMELEFDAYRRRDERAQDTESDEDGGLGMD